MNQTRKRKTCHNPFYNTLLHNISDGEKKERKRKCIRHTTRFYSAESIMVHGVYLYTKRVKCVKCTCGDLNYSIFVKVNGIINI